MEVVGLIIDWALRLYMLAFFGRMILSWVPMFAPDFSPKGIVAALFEGIYWVTDPPIKFFRRFIPPLRLGRVALDVAFMAAFVSLIVLSRINAIIFLY